MIPLTTPDEAAGVRSKSAGLTTLMLILSGREAIRLICEPLFGAGTPEEAPPAVLAERPASTRKARGVLINEIVTPDLARLQSALPS